MTDEVPKGLRPQPGDKDCTQAEGRDHKWEWKNDIQSGMPHPYLAICVHCGVERRITRKTDEPQDMTP